MKNLSKGLSGNQLKILGAIFMTVDHVGLYLFPNLKILRVIGRLAFPIFAFCLAEGCKYTKNRPQHLLTVSLLAILCQAGYTLATKSLYLNILFTFALSQCVIYSFDIAKEKKTVSSYLLVASILLSVFIVHYKLPQIIKHGFGLDYGFCGVMIPVLVYLGRTKQEKLFMLFAGLLLLSPTMSTRQLFAILAVPIVALYNGERGQLNMKNFFYIYYPAHLAVLFLLRHIIGYFN